MVCMYRLPRYSGVKYKRLLFSTARQNWDSLFGLAGVERVTGTGPGETNVMPWTASWLPKRNKKNQKLSSLFSTNCNCDNL